MRTTTLKQISCLLALTLLACAARAQTGWTNTYGPALVIGGVGPGGAVVFSPTLAADANGNVFVAGESSDESSYVILKYSNAGMPLWTNFYTSAGGVNYYSASLAVDGSGNVFVTGQSFDASLNENYVTLKYSNAGVPLWTNLCTLALGAETAAIAVDGNGNAFVTGQSFDASLNANYVTLKYSNGGVPLWTNLYTVDSISAQASALAVDGVGNVFVTGSSATIKYSNAGTPLWTNLSGGNAIALDTNGNVFVTASPWTLIKYSNAGMPIWTNLYTMAGGAWANAIAVDNTGSAFVTGRAGTNYATVKYSNAGMSLWTNLYTMAGGASAGAIAVDGNGNAFVTGQSYGATNAYAATLKYSNAGVPLWTNLYTMDGTRGENPAIVVDGNGNAFVTGGAYDGTSYYYFTIKNPAASVTPVAYLQGQWLNQQLVLSWTNAGFGLQAAPAVTGTFTNLPGATSPYTNPVSFSQQFFRLMQQN